MDKDELWWVHYIYLLTLNLFGSLQCFCGKRMTPLRCIMICVGGCSRVSSHEGGRLGVRVCHNQFLDAYAIASVRQPTYFCRDSQEVEGTLFEGNHYHHRLNVENCYIFLGYSNS